MLKFLRESREFQAELMGKVDSIIEMIGGLNVRDLPQRVGKNLDFYEHVVKSNLPGLPYDVVKSLAAMNVKLTNSQVAVSLVRFFFYHLFS